MTQRSFNRKNDALRPISLEPGVNRYAEGSCLVSFGYTKIICTASVEDRVPPFLRGRGKGWVTAEYSMLPRATDVRTKRERDKTSSRSVEIQRLIGRSLRMTVNMNAIGERTITLDCDVLQADGGTRTAAITGAYVALAMAIRSLQKRGIFSREPKKEPLIETVGAVSVGVHNERALLDLDFKEDSSCCVDMNLVMTGEGKFVELQGTAEGKAFDGEALQEMLSLGKKGIQEINELQQRAIDKSLKMI